MFNPSITDRLEKMSFYPCLHHLLPYESYEPDTQLFYHEDSTGFLLIGHPIVGASLKDQQQMNQFFRQEQNLPEGASLQFLLIASPCIGQNLTYWQEARLGDIFQKLALRRREFLEEKAYFDVHDLLVRDYRILISYTVPGHQLDLLAQQQILNTRKELKSVLKTMGMHCSNGNAEDLIREVGNLLNFKNRVYPHQGQWNEHDSISKQIIDHDKNFHAQENELLLNDGETLCRSYTSKVSPNYWSLSHMDRFLGNLLESRQKISTPYLIHYGIFVDRNQTKSKSKVFAKRESLENSLKGGLSKYMPTLNEQYEEILDLATQMQLGERVILSSLSFTLLSTPHKIQEHEQQMRSIWQDCGWTFQPARYDHLPLFLSNLPMTWTVGAKKGLMKSKPYGMATNLEKMSKAKKTITKEAQNMLPILGEWKGQSAPGIPLMGRRGQLFFWNPFSTAFLPGSLMAQTTEDYNVCIAGAPGSGKSVLMNEMMATVMGVGGKVFVMDMGRSFKKTCQILGGQHIEFDIATPMSINPFTHITQEERSREEELAAVIAIFKAMAAPQHGTTALEDSYIEQAVRYSWERYGSKGSVDTVKEFLDNHADLAATNLGQTLYSFSSSGSFGHFFNKPANASLKERLVVIETDDLRHYPSLMAVVVQMLIIQINQEMAKGDRTTPFLIIIDEAWQLLKGKSTGDFISAATRTSRKYKGSIVLGTQHLTDYFKPESPGATEAFKASAWKVILYQKPDTISALKHHQQLQDFVGTDFKEALLKSIHSEPPHYSEMAIFGEGMDGIVGRLHLDSFSRFLYSTDAEDHRLIEEYIQQGASIEEAIELVIAIQAETILHAA